jgi:hypothetical protein
MAHYVPVNVHPLVPVPPPPAGAVPTLAEVCDAARYEEQILLTRQGELAAHCPLGRRRCLRSDVH